MALSIPSMAWASSMAEGAGAWVGDTPVDDADPLMLPCLQGWRWNGCLRGYTRLHI